MQCPLTALTILILRNDFIPDKSFALKSPDIRIYASTSLWIVLIWCSFFHPFNLFVFLYFKNISIYFYITYRHHMVGSCFFYPICLSLVLIGLFRPHTLIWLLTWLCLSVLAWYLFSICLICSLLPFPSFSVFFWT